MDRVCWAIESGVFPHIESDIIEAVKAVGQDYVVFEDALDYDVDNMVMIGSTELYEKYPTKVIGIADKFYYSAYYIHFKSVLLNHPRFVSISNFLENRVSLARVFVRPDSPLKPFSGRIISVADANLESFDYGFYHENENLLIMVCEVQKIDAEWRFVIVNGDVVTGCQYDDRRGVTTGTAPPSVYELAQKVATYKWQPSYAYVADICLCDSRVKLIELNPLSSADLYSCDVKKVVKSVSLFLTKED